MKDHHHKLVTTGKYHNTNESEEEEEVGEARHVLIYSILKKNGNPEEKVSEY